MKSIRRASVFFWAGFCLLLCLPDAARAQEVPRTYLYVEVKDTAGQPVTDAAIKASVDDAFDYVSPERRELIREWRTGQDGATSGEIYAGFRLPAYFDFQVSKPGYLPFEDILPSRPHPSFGVIESHVGGSAWNLKVVLLKTPLAGPERRAVEREQQRRELLLAAKRGDAASVRRLLRAGASANAADAWGVPAVAWAALMGRAGAVEALLDGGADVRDKGSPAHQSLLVYLDTSLPYCRNRAMDAKDEVAGELCDSVIRKLAAAGAAVNPRDSHVRPALYSALENTPHNMSVKSFRALIRAGANVRHVDDKGLTMLMHAASGGPAEAVKALLDAGVPINARDRQGRTALSYTAQYARHGSGPLKVLLQAGADVNAADRDGRTPLMYAAAAERYTAAEKVPLLLAAGARADLADKDGRTALVIAQEAHNGEIVALLEAAVRRR